MVTENRVCCATCPFWEKITDPANLTSKQGKCVRNPPSAFPAGQGILNIRPVTPANDICGEHPQHPSKIKLEVSQ